MIVDEDLGQQKKLLKYILTLDLAQCHVAVCIASGEPDNGAYQFRLIDQSQKLAQKFREAIEEALKDYRKQLDDDNIELQNFVAETTQSAQEIEYLNILPYDSIKRQVAPVEQHLDLPHFEHNESGFIKNMRFYVIRVQPPDGPLIYFYRNYSSSQMLSQSRFFAGFLQQDYYDNLEQPTFLFDRHIDCISCEDYMFILQKNNFFKIFDIKELEKVARVTLDKLERKNFIHNFQRFKSDCLDDKIKILKLKNISTKEYMDTLTIDDMHENIQRYKLPIQVDIVGGRKKLIYNPKERWAILHLLDDTFSDSPMTGISYHVKGKREIGTAGKGRRRR